MLDCTVPIMRGDWKMTPVGRLVTTTAARNNV